MRETGLIRVVFSIGARVGNGRARRGMGAPQSAKSGRYVNHSDRHGVIRVLA
jgi:hypothetical protein